MEPTALRPKPMPGRRPDDDTPSAPGARRPYTAPRRRCRRLTAVLTALLLGLVLLLSGIGLGTTGATVIGLSRLAELQRHTGPGAPGSPASARPGSSDAPSPSPAPAPVVATLGVEAVDDARPGARLVGVHVPGPGHTAGLIRGDVVLTFGRTRID